MMSPISLQALCRRVRLYYAVHRVERALYAERHHVQADGPEKT